MERATSIDITWSSLWKVLIVALLGVGVYYSANILIAVFVAIIISSALNPFVSFLEYYRVPRVLGTIIVFLSIALTIAVFLYALTPALISEVRNLLNKFLEQFFPYLEQWFNIDISKLSNIFTISLDKVKALLPIGSEAGLLKFSRSIIGDIALILSVFAMSFYLTVDHHGVERFLRAILPESQEGRIIGIFLKARRKMGYWFQAQILLSFFVAIIVFMGLWILGVPHALVLGILAGVFEIVPFVGPVFTGTLAVLISLSASFNLAMYTLILFIVVQQIENHILVPLFMNRAVGLHPVAVLISLLLGASFFGIVGVIVAVPATVIIQEFVDDWAEKKARRQRLV